MRRIFTLATALAAFAAVTATASPSEARGIKIRWGSGVAAAATPKYVYVPRVHAANARTAGNTPRNEAEVSDRAEAAAIRARAALAAESGSGSGVSAQAASGPSLQRASSRERSLPNGVVCIAGC